MISPSPALTKSTVNARRAGRFALLLLFLGLGAGLLWKAAAGRTAGPTTGATGSTPFFTDVTAQSGISFTHFNGAYVKKLFP